MWLIRALLIMTLAGCAAAPSADTNALEIDATEYARVYDATVDTLRAFGFHVDRKDYRFGRVTSRALPAPTGAEPWKGINLSVNVAAQSTFNYQRRIVNVYFDPMPAFAVANVPAPTGAGFPRPKPIDSASTDPGTGKPPIDTYNMRVEAILQRAQRPSKYMTGATGGHHITGNFELAPDDLAERGVEKQYWQTIGRDELLERHLLAVILRSSFIGAFDDKAAPSGDQPSP